MKISKSRNLIISNLRVDARLGILDHEKEAPQPISVDAELELGSANFPEHFDSITGVLDYREIHAIITASCTAQHTNLIETLTDNICHQILCINGVTRVRVKITKLKIFSDCEVAIEQTWGKIS